MATRTTYAMRVLGAVSLALVPASLSCPLLAFAALYTGLLALALAQ